MGISLRASVQSECDTRLRRPYASVWCAVFVCVSVNVRMEVSTNIKENICEKETDYG